MTRPQFHVRRRALSWTALGLVIACAGCEILADFDRSKSPGEEAGDASLDQSVPGEGGHVDVTNSDVVVPGNDAGDAAPEAAVEGGGGGGGAASAGGGGATTATGAGGGAAFAGSVTVTSCFDANVTSTSFDASSCASALILSV